MFAPRTAPLPGRIAAAALAVLMRAALPGLAVGAPGLAVAQAQPVPAATEPLTIATSGGDRVFAVEVARTDADRQQGLMYRRTMAPDAGMLFDFKTVEPVSMWMKNTYLSLDMVFIRPDGTVARIAERTEPLSTRIISSGEPVNAVLELSAGTAKRLGIKPGDIVRHPLFPAR